MLDQARGDWRETVRGEALGLLLGGAVIFYFGMSLVARAPAAATSAEAERWFTLDNALFLGLRILGGVMILVGGVAWLGQPVALLLAAVSELALALLLLAISALWTLRAQFSGAWDPQVLLLLLVAAISIAACVRAMRLFLAWRAQRAAAQRSAER